MDGKICKDGSLEIKRTDLFKTQDCPFRSYHFHGKQESCGDWCPHFGEPKPQCSEHSFPAKVILEICHGKILYFDKFSDQREQ